MNQNKPPQTLEEAAELAVIEVNKCAQEQVCEYATDINLFKAGAEWAKRNDSNVLALVREFKRIIHECDDLKSMRIASNAILEWDKENSTLKD